MTRDSVYGWPDGYSGGKGGRSYEDKTTCFLTYDHGGQVPYLEGQFIGLTNRGFGCITPDQG